MSLIKTRQGLTRMKGVESKGQLLIQNNHVTNRHFDVTKMDDAILTKGDTNDA